MIRIGIRPLLRLIRINSIDKFNTKAEEGRFGKRLRICRYLDIPYYSSCRKTPESERNLNDIEGKYDEIRLFVMPRGVESRLGEIVGRAAILLRNVEERNDSRSLPVIRISEGKNDVNISFITVLRRRITVIPDDEALLWYYALMKFPRVVWDYSCFERGADKRYYSDDMTKKWFGLSDEENHEGFKKLSDMGVTKPFVCFANRDEKYLIKTIGNTFSYHNFRNSGIYTRARMIEYLYSKGIMSVRMGKFAENAIEMPGVVDYANHYYDSLMDMFLTKECKFYVNDGSGIDVFAYMYGRPHVLVNDILDMSAPGVGGYPQSKDTIVIFKKIWDKDKGRFLRYDETLETQWLYIFGNLSDSRKEQLVFVENSEEDILEAVIEMNDRLDGTWKDSDEDIELQQEVMNIISEHCDKHGFVENQRYIGRVGADFIRKNRSILGL